MNSLSPSDILTKDEVRAVLNNLRERRGHKNPRQNEVVFRLAVCCGLRVSEMNKLCVGDVQLGGPKPFIRLQKKNVKGKHRMRTVPLWWDAENLAVIIDWVQLRKSQGAKVKDPLICAQELGVEGKPQIRSTTSRRWKAAIRLALGNERTRQLSIHCGRHTFASHALAVGRSPVEVQQALGHSSLAQTAIYAHVVERDGIPNLYS